MKLLFDQNLSPNLVTYLADLFPDSRHVSQFRLDRSQDRDVFDFARREAFIIVTKDADFGELGVFLGFPPNVVWIRRGNCSTSTIEQILRHNYDEILMLESDPSKGVLTVF